MVNIPNKPKFTCRVCNAVMCEDCKLMAAEFETLYGDYKLYLISARDQIEALKRENEQLKRHSERMEELAKTSFGTTMQEFMEWKIKQISKPQARKSRR